MGIINSLFEETRAGWPPDDDRWYMPLAGGVATSSGIRIDSQKSMMYSAVYACVRLIAEAVSTLPLHLYRSTDRGKERVKNNPLYALLHDSPNPEIPAVLYREAMMVHLLLHGNSYSEIVRDGSNRVRSLWLINPARVRLTRNGNDRVLYEVRLPDGGISMLGKTNMLHIPGFGFDGFMGMNPIDYHRETVGLGIAAQEYGSRFFENNARPSGVLQHPAKLSNEASVRLRESWENAHKGLKNSHRIAILEEGLQFKEISISQSAAQYLETRRFQMEEICRIFRVPPHMISSTADGVTSVEQKSIEFVVHCIRPWLTRLEQVYNFSLLTTSGLSGLFYEHVIDGLLRGDIQSRYQAYSIGRQQGWLSVNEIRAMENMNTIDDGDVYLQPLNMVEAGKQLDVNPNAVKPKNPVDVKSTFDKKAMPDEPEIRSLGDPVESGYKKKLQKSFQGIVEKEVMAIQHAAGSMLQQRGYPEFREFLTGFYKDHEPYVYTRLRPIIESHANEIFRQANLMIGVENVEMNTDFQAFAADYLEKLAFRYCRRGQAELTYIIDTVSSIDFVRDEVMNRVSEWATGRAESVATDEAVRQQNAFARETWKQGGVKRLKWKTRGSETCPFCKAINGKTVSIEQNFIEANDVIHAKPEELITDINNPLYGKGFYSLKVYSAKKHPPMHKGCRCTITPV